MADNTPTRVCVMAALIAGGHSEESARFITAIQFRDIDGDEIIMDEEGNPVDDEPTHPWDHLPVDNPKQNPPKQG